jgi:hypothetical protein
MQLLLRIPERDLGTQPYGAHLTTLLANSSLIVAFVEGLIERLRNGGPATLSELLH